ncbi:MAG TPA: barstar family protein, partial [Steroidobacteraceae bacterium]|nr:barstar family protein [Steroidobacteraceae bacterium]
MNERAAAFGAGPVHVAPLTASATAAVCALARSLGLDTTRIDLFDCRSKSELLDRVAAALDFPSTFGHNWDALFDCLADLGWRPATGYVLVFEHAAALRKTEP